MRPCAPVAQVMLAAFAALPPSAWFSPSNPLPFLGMYASVFGASVVASRLHGALCAAAVARLPGKRPPGKRRAAVWLSASSASKAIAEQ